MECDADTVQQDAEKWTGAMLTLLQTPTPPTDPSINDNTEVKNNKVCRATAPHLVRYNDNTEVKTNKVGIATAPPLVRCREMDRGYADFVTNTHTTY